MTRRALLSLILALVSPSLFDLDGARVQREMDKRCRSMAARRTPGGLTARERAQLAQLNDAALKDLGLSRADVLQEAERPFWDDPLRK